MSDILDTQNPKDSEAIRETAAQARQYHLMLLLYLRERFLRTENRGRSIRHVASIRNGGYLEFSSQSSFGQRWQKEKRAGGCGMTGNRKLPVRS